MPDFAAGEWLNSAQPLTRDSLRGQVVLVDFWDYTCVNCLRTLPYLVEWHRRYRDKGLVLIGIHAPEFKFGRGQQQIEAAIAEYRLLYPILLDNEYQTWERFANKAWPTKHLIDMRGYIRLQRRGEGHYREVEQAIQQLLRQRDPAVHLPELLPPLRDEDQPGAVCYRPTPELYAGYQGGGLFGGALGNPDGYFTDSLFSYTLPEPEQRRSGHFYLAGFWRAEPEAVAFAGQSGGQVVVPYEAVGVNAVLSPSSDPVALLLDLWPDEPAPQIEVRQDGRPLTPLNAGADIIFDDDGRSLVTVLRPRMYELVRSSNFGAHELELIFQSSGLALYAVTFTTCVAADPTQPGDTLLHMP